MEHLELSWIHLSDLHIETTDTFNRKVVFDALWKDMEKFIRDGMTPDFVVFTGDIARNAQKHEYELAISEFFDPLLKTTSISKERLFIVPGNHDANWNITSKLKNPIPSITGTDDIRRLIEESESRDLILTPFANYSSFIRSYLGGPSKSVNDSAFYTVNEIEKGGTKIVLMGLNSAWLSGFNKNVEGKVDDFGKLAVGEFQIVKAQETFDTAQIVIALLHHPFDWLMEADRNAVEHRLTESCNIILRGHLHRPNVLSESSLAGDIVIIPAGAVFETRHFPNAYNLVRLNLRTGEGRVFLRRYNRERNEWQKDIESTGEQGDGQGTFKLRNFWRNAAYGGEPEPSKIVWNYACVFTDECKKDMAKLNLGEGDVLRLVQDEFQGHLNYFRFDLEDYPLPVRSSFIIYLDKVQKRIEFRKIIPCTRNEAKLTSWNDVLALYRRATRLSYRDKPENILFLKGMLGRTTELHFEMRRRLQKHFEVLEHLMVNPLTLGLRGELALRSGSHSTSPLKTSERGTEISYHLGASDRADSEVHDVVTAMDHGDINHTEALALIVSELERSLQHIHKILLLFPPIDN